MNNVYGLSLIKTHLNKLDLLKVSEIFHKELNEQVTLENCQAYLNSLLEGNVATLEGDCARFLPAAYRAALRALLAQVYALKKPFVRSKI